MEDCIVQDVEVMILRRRVKILSSISLDLDARDVIVGLLLKNKAQRKWYLEVFR